MIGLFRYFQIRVTHIFYPISIKYNDYNHIVITNIVSSSIYL